MVESVSLVEEISELAEPQQNEISLYIEFLGIESLLYSEVIRFHNGQSD